MEKLIIAALPIAAFWYFQDTISAWIGGNLVDIVAALAIYSIWSNYALAKHIERLQGIVDRMQAIS